MRSWLIAIREEAGLSQKTVAERAGIAQPSYCNIENDSRRPAVKTAKAIARVLSFDWTIFYEKDF